MKKISISLLIVLLLIIGLSVSYANNDLQLFGNDIRITNGNNPEGVVFSLQLILILTVLTLIPSILIMMTGFTRVILVLGFIRNATGLQQTPPNQVLIGLAFFITLFIMSPIVSEINDTALQPYLEERISQSEALKNAEIPIKNFMFRQTRTKDLQLFMNLKGIEKVESTEDIPLHVLIPAFLISELKTAFQIGFILFIPFLVIDMVVASTLMAMGMMMLPPVIISLPFKILLFLLVDGWNLVIKSMVLGFK